MCVTSMDKILQYKIACAFILTFVSRLNLKRLRISYLYITFEGLNENVLLIVVGYYYHICTFILMCINSFSRPLVEISTGTTLVMVIKTLSNE